MPRTVFWLWCIQGSEQQICIFQTPYSHYWHLSIGPLVACGLVKQHRKDQCQVSVARRWQLFCISTHAKSLASQLLLKEFKKMEIAGHKVQTAGICNLPAAAPGREAVHNRFCVNQAVTSWPQTLDTHLFNAGIEPLLAVVAQMP